MKNMSLLLMCACIVLPAFADTKVTAQKLSKKDREDLVAMFVDFLDGMEKSSEPIRDQMENRRTFWESPVTRLEKSIGQLNETANNIQNYIIDVNNTIDNSDDTAFQTQVLSDLSGLSQTLARVNSKLALIESQAAQIVQTVGSVNDVSVDANDFSSVQDIDDAQLSIVSLFKTILRVFLQDNFIS